jgi:hypothetical protein
MSFGGHVIEQGSTRPGRWLRGRRLKITLSVAAVEALLVVVHVLHLWEVVILAIVAVAVWLYAARRSRSDLIRQLGWIFAVSQLLVLTVPIGLAILSTIAIVLFALLAVAALVFLFTERP